MPADQYLTPDDLLMGPESFPPAPTGAGPAPAPAPAPRPSSGWETALKAILPTIAAVLAGRQGAALPALAGYTTGVVGAQRYRDEQARLAEEQQRRDELVQVQQQRTRQAFMQQFLQTLQQAETPAQHDAIVRQFAEMAGPLGINPNRLYHMPFDDTKPGRISRKQWGEAIKAVNVQDLLKSGYTPEKIQSSQVTNPYTGEKLSYRDAWGLAGMPSYQDQPLLPLPAPPDAPLTVADVMKRMPPGVQARALDWINQHPGDMPPPMLLNQWESEDRRENKQDITINVPGADATPAIPIGVTGESVLEGVPEADKALVRKISEYRIPLPGGMALRSPKWQRILELVAAYDPSFDASQYEQRRRMRIDFNVGKGGQNIRSLNTAVGHLGTLEEKVRALENSSYDLWNKIRNFGVTRIGDPRVVDFNVAANAVAGELATLFKNTSGTDQEIKAWREQIDASQSPQQLRAAIDTAVELLGSRLSVLQAQYEAGMGKPKDFIILQPKARRVLQRLGVNVSAFDPMPPGAAASSAPPSTEGDVQFVYDPATDEFRPVRKRR